MNARAAMRCSNQKPEIAVCIVLMAPKPVHPYKSLEERIVVAKH